MAPGLQHINKEDWSKLQKLIDDSEQIGGVSEEYVRAEKQFANELYQALIQGYGSKKPWLGMFGTPERFEKEYSAAVFRTLEKYLHSTKEQDIKRNLIALTNYFQRKNPHYFPIFPIIEERIDKQGIYDAGDCFVRLSVLLPNGKHIPLATERGN